MICGSLFLLIKEPPLKSIKSPQYHSVEVSFIYGIKGPIVKSNV